MVNREGPNNQAEISFGKTKIKTSIPKDVGAILLKKYGPNYINEIVAQCIKEEKVTDSYIDLVSIGLSKFLNLLQIYYFIGEILKSGKSPGAEKIDDWLSLSISSTRYIAEDIIRYCEDNNIEIELEQGISGGNTN